jgi:hypothetical protein
MRGCKRSLKGLRLVRRDEAGIGFCCQTPIDAMHLGREILYEERGGRVLSVS